MKKSLIILLSLCGFALSASMAHASGLVYHGINSNITPSAPYNPTYLGTADNTRPYNPKTVTKPVSDLELARQNAINAAMSSLTAGCPVGNATCGGPITLPDGSVVNYTTGIVNGVNMRTITLPGPNGTTTTLSFPIS